ncbi:MAG TPA: spore coat protein [Bacilli bacterium]|nr:spore coat protein [Bacilli bacterium]
MNGMYPFGTMGGGTATMQPPSQGQGLRFGAHEFLETNEALRSKASIIELNGVLINQAQDPHLRDILSNQQRRMVQAYQMGVGLLNNQGMAQMNMPHTPQMNVYERPQIGLNHPQSPAPNPNARQLSDRTIAEVALGLHKSSAVMSMNWALECVQPNIRTYHATGANLCQEMAYECWQYLNYNGYYQVPQLADHTMNTMIESYSY